MSRSSPKVYSHCQRSPWFDCTWNENAFYSEYAGRLVPMSYGRDAAEEYWLLRPGGKLIFSNNYRRFKLDYDALAAFEVRDITTQTLDPDFKRNQRIHVCFEITHKA